MLFPSISMTVIKYTCTIRLLFNELKFFIMVSYTIFQHRLHTSLSEYHQTFKIMSRTRCACTYLHADTGLCTSFYSGSFAEELAQIINYHKPLFLL